VYPFSLSALFSLSIGTLISCRPMVATRPKACFLLANFRKFNTWISIPIVKILSVVGVSGQNTINRAFPRWGRSDPILAPNGSLGKLEAKDRPRAASIYVLSIAAPADTRARFLELGYYQAFQQYSGRAMRGSHEQLKITETEWAAFCKDFDDTMAKFGVPDAEKNELFAIVQSTKGDIVIG
jgi:hypothetical protein